MIDKNHSKLSMRKQCDLLFLNRSSLYYRPKGENPDNLNLMRLIDEEYLKHPFYGSRKLAFVLRSQGHDVSRHRVRRLMQKMGIEAIYQKPRTSMPNKEHRIYPYLLKGLVIDRPNQVWATDITYIPMKRGFMYLVAVIDWYSRKVLSWRLSNTLDTDFCVEALKEAIETHGVPSIFNTDQGCQFTSTQFRGCQNFCASGNHDGYQVWGKRSGKRMENWAKACFHSLMGIVHFFEAFCKAKKMSLMAA